VLLQLKVSNYALIDSLDLDFNSGFTVLTGETGSGKSIIIGALGLVLGERADSKVLFSRDRKCVVEACFEMPKAAFEPFFLKHDLDHEDHTVVRREINKTGKSRAFVNDTPVNLAQLKELADQLIDIHSQHQTLLIRKPDFQLDIVDSFAKSAKIKLEYQKEYDRFLTLSDTLEELEKRNAKAIADLDYNQFQTNELQAANLEKADLEGMEAELILLNNAENLKELAVKFSSGFSGEGGVLMELSELKAVASKLSNISPEFSALDERLSSAVIELRDIAEEVESKTARLEFDPDRIETLSGQLNELNRLLYKHNKTTVPELIQIRTDLECSLGYADDLHSKIESVKKEQHIAEQKVQHVGSQLSLVREGAIGNLQKGIEAFLSQLSMTDARIRFNLEKGQQPTRSGLDHIQLLVSMNKGSEFQSIDRSASGGELSRIMLALKTILSEGAGLQSIVFDEIDTGVSGEIANQVAELMGRISQKMQVITITHLPQLAAKGRQHYKVFKESKDEGTNTKIVALNSDERLVEIAEMLSGKNPSKAAVQNARELLN